MSYKSNSIPTISVTVFLFSRIHSPSVITSAWRVHVMLRLPKWINKSKVNCLSHNSQPEYSVLWVSQAEEITLQLCSTQQVQEQISSDITDSRITAGPQQGLSVWHSSLCLCLSSVTKNSVSWADFSPLQRISVSLCVCIIINKGVKYSVICGITEWRCKIGPNDSVWCSVWSLQSDAVMVQIKLSELSTRA